MTFPDDNKYRFGFSTYIYLFYYSLGLFNVKYIIYVTERYEE